MSAVHSRKNLGRFCKDLAVRQFTEDESLKIRMEGGALATVVLDGTDAASYKRCIEIISPLVEGLTRVDIKAIVAENKGGIIKELQEGGQYVTSALSSWKYDDFSELQFIKVITSLLAECHLITVDGRRATATKFFRKDVHNWHTLHVVIDNDHRDGNYVEYAERTGTDIPEVAILDNYRKNFNSRLHSLDQLKGRITDTASRANSSESFDMMRPNNKYIDQALEEYIKVKFGEYIQLLEKAGYMPGPFDVNVHYHFDKYTISYKMMQKVTPKGSAKAIKS